MAKKTLADAEIKPCIKCGRLVVAYSPNHLYCDNCRKEEDKKNSLAYYYRKKLEAGLAPVSTRGQRRVPDAPVVHSGFVYDADEPAHHGQLVRRTCAKGHLLAGDNLLESAGRRRCKTCLRNWEWNRSHPAPEKPAPKERERIVREHIVRRAQQIAPLAELWPYGVDDPLILAIAALIPISVPDWVRADAGQQVYLDCLEGRVDEGDLQASVQRAIKSAWGAYTISLDWRREDGYSLYDRLEDEVSD